jgi:hypothetical protein
MAHGMMPGKPLKNHGNHLYFSHDENHRFNTVEYDKPARNAMHNIPAVYLCYIAVPAYIIYVKANGLQLQLVLLLAHADSSPTLPHVQSYIVSNAVYTTMANFFLCEHSMQQTQQLLWRL